MNQPLPKVVPAATLIHMEELIDGLTDGIILMDLTGVILWANQAALTMHGARSLEELGRTADDYCKRYSLKYRNNHRLSVREYPIIRTLAGESFPDMIVEVARMGEDEPRWVHQVRDVVLEGGDGEPDCLALVIQDCTERFEAEERFERAFQANPAPAIIMRLSDQRFVKVNRGFLEMTGYTREALIGRNLYDVDLLSGADRPTFVRERLAAGDTIPQMEAEIPLPNGLKRLVIVAGQPLELFDERCMLFTFADLEPRRKAENALRASEERFATMFRLTPVAIAITSLDGQRIVEVNQAFGKLTGYTPAHSIGRSPDELGLWPNAEQRREIEEEVIGRGGICNRDVTIVHQDGHQVSCLLSAERVTVRDERCIIWLYQDITARRHTELELIEAIEGVMKDTSWFSRTVMEKLANLREPCRASTQCKLDELSRREREVLELICEGLDDKAIAERLSLSSNTVRNHVARIYAKIGVNRRSAAMVWARQRGVGVGRG